MNTYTINSSTCIIEAEDDYICDKYWDIITDILWDYYQAYNSIPKRAWVQIEDGDYINAYEMYDDDETGDCIGNEYIGEGDDPNPPVWYVRPN